MSLNYEPASVPQHLLLQRRWVVGVRDLVRERKFFIDNLLVRIHFIVEMIWWTGLTPWESEFPFPCSLISTFLLGETIYLEVKHAAGS